ncbi:MAG: putative membrane protein [Haloquadratum sp. J07HQX50]|jgi:Predicted membrane protein (DUF2078).|nr:MAG: putative membrane protein [Haloquadratum sp. J07HQX50]
MSQRSKRHFEASYLTQPLILLGGAVVTSLVMIIATTLLAEIVPPLLHAGGPPPSAGPPPGAGAPLGAGPHPTGHTSRLLFYLIAIIGSTLSLFAALHALSSRTSGTEAEATADTPLDTLRERYISGEITDAEFKQQVERMSKLNPSVIVDRSNQRHSSSNTDTHERSDATERQESTDK